MAGITMTELEFCRLVSRVAQTSAEWIGDLCDEPLGRAVQPFTVERYLRDVRRTLRLIELGTGLWDPVAEATPEILALGTDGAGI
jgi:hypothetical protein